MRLGEVTCGDDLESTPGLDLGPLAPALLARLPKNWAAIDLCPTLYDADRERAEATVSTFTEPGLVLIGRRQLRSNNSWLHNSKRLVKGPKRCTLLMHPDDASARGITSGQAVSVTSRVGEVQVAVEVTDEIMPRVVSLPHGWGHGREGVSWSTAAEHAGISINDLTDETRVDALSGNAALSGTPVEVKPIAGQDAASA